MANPKAIPPGRRGVARDPLARAGIECRLASGACRSQWSQAEFIENHAAVALRAGYDPLMLCRLPKHGLEVVINRLGGPRQDRAAVFGMAEGFLKYRQVPFGHILELIDQ